MKDLYSLHTTEADLNDFYWKVSGSYTKIFKKLGFDAKLVEAAGGVFTDNITHEFQVINTAGEDTIFHCAKCDWAQNKEIAKVKEGDKCPKCGGTIFSSKSIEVGNIFRFGISYSEKMNVAYIDRPGKKQLVYLGSYGIGITRAIATLVELFHDDRGIVWPEQVAPYQVHLISLGESGEAIYKKLTEAGIEVLYDDRDGATAGEKFADADLIGIPHRLIVSKKTGEKVEYKKRTEKESKLVDLESIIKDLK